MALQYGTPGGASRGPALEAARSPGTGRHQSVVSVPHARFIAMLTYQAELVGIQMQITRERSMGKARFLDADPLPVSGEDDIPVFSGKRVRRGLYRLTDGRRNHRDAKQVVQRDLPRPPCCCWSGYGKGNAGAAAVHPVWLPLTH